MKNYPELGSIIGSMYLISGASPSDDITSQASGNSSNLLRSKLFNEWPDLKPSNSATILY